MAQDTIIGYTKLPVEKPIYFDFYINDIGLIELPYLGGIFLPDLNKWTVKPVTGARISNTILNYKDSLNFTILTDSVESTLLVADAGKKKSIARLAVFAPGNYSIDRLNQTIVIWGRSKSKSRIGVLLKDRIQWLQSTTDFISDVEVTLAGQIFCASGSKIYSVLSKKLIVNLPQKILNLAYDPFKNKLYFSTGSGTFHLDTDQGKIIPKTKLHGLIECRNNHMFVLDLRNNCIWETILN